MPARQQQARKEQELPSSIALYRLPVEGVAQPQDQDQRYVFLPQSSQLEMDSPTSNQAKNIS